MTDPNIIDKARADNRTRLNEIEAKQLLHEAGINVVETKLATSKEEALAISETIGFPVVMKIASADVVHKSDAGGVKVGLRNTAQVEEAYEVVISNVLL